MKTISVENYKKLLKECLELQKARVKIEKLKKALDEKRRVIQGLKKKVNYYSKDVAKSSVSPYINVFVIRNIIIFYFV